MKTDGPIIILCWCQVKSVFGEDKVASKGLMEWEIRYCPHCGKDLKRDGVKKRLRGKR